MSELPSEFSVGGIHESVALPTTTSATVIEKALSEALAWPSETEILMPEYVATSEALGVPVTRPVDALNVAHAGRPVTENVSVSLFGSLAEGWNE